MVTQQEVKNYLGVDYNPSMNTFVEMVIGQVTGYIEKYCGDDVFGKRKFVAPEPDNAEVRTFSGNNMFELKIGDLREIVSLEVDGISLVKDEDYFLYPLNAKENGEPYTSIQLLQPETRLGGFNNNPRLIGSSPYIFEQRQGNVKVNAKWGFSAVPPAEIKLATLKLAGGVLKENIGDSDIREVKSMTFDDYRVDFQAVANVSHAIGVDDILKPYKRVKVEPAMSGLRVI